MKKAIVTLVVGDRCYKPWHRYLRAGWEQWAEVQGYDLIVFDRLLDQSFRGLSRSPAWQKLLAMSVPELSGYDQALWLDADVVLNPEAPDPLHGLSGEAVAMARDVGSPLSHEPLWFRQCWSQVLRVSLRQVMDEMDVSLCPQKESLFSYLYLWGFDASRYPLYNTGVIGFSPRHHSCLFADVYRRWHDGGPGALYEMIPLNLELLQRRMIYELDANFNQLAGVQHAVWHHMPDHAQRWLGLAQHRLESKEFLDELMSRSYFLHFAGAQGLMLKYMAATRSLSEGSEAF